VLKSCIDVIVHASQENDVSPVNHTRQQQINQSYCQLFQEFGYTASSAPVADFLKRYYGLSGDWSIASPIHWQATHRDATIRYADSMLKISDEESRRLFNAFSSFIEQYNMQLYYHDETTWLIQTTAHPIPLTTPVHLLIDKSMSPELRMLETKPFWLRFITESQMFFSSMKSNVNGLWFWGGGAPQQIPNSRPLILCGDEHWLVAANHISKTVSCFDASTPIIRNSVYFVPNAHWIKASHLESYLSEHSVRWHWNNMTDLSKPKSWFFRLIRR
jgi:hypothetical protein